MEGSAGRVVQRVGWFFGQYMPIRLPEQQLDLILFGYLSWSEIVAVGQSCEELADRIEVLTRIRDGKRIFRNWQQIEQSVHSLLPNPLFIPTPDIPYSGRHYQLPFRFASPELIAYYTPSSSSTTLPAPLPYWIHYPIANIEPDPNRPTETHPPQAWEF